MKSYSPETIFSFGKYSGKSLITIAHTAPDYINWCIVNLDHFYINESDLTSLGTQCPTFELDQKTSEVNMGKTEKANKIREAAISWMNADDDEERGTFDKYNGSYAQEVEGYSDQDIDDIFDGDPSAYWNID